MKKTVLMATIFCTSMLLSAHADTSTAPVQQSSQAAPATSNNTSPVKPERPVEKKQESQSVYDSVKSGWNSFIDVLAGPPAK